MNWDNWEKAMASMGWRLPKDEELPPELLKVRQEVRRAFKEQDVQDRRAQFQLIQGGVK